MRAYTLLEIVIVLALLTVVMLLVGMAMDIHLRQMTISRTEIEEAQLARTVLNKIAGEIRSVIVLLREETATTDAASVRSTLNITVAAEETDPEGEETETETAEEEKPVIYGEKPGIYGDLNWIQIDTARLPRGEMYASRQIRRGTSPRTDRLSSSKTVLYYLGKDTGQMTADDPRYLPDALIGAAGRSAEPNSVQYGLYRRQLDRQVMQYAIQEGTESEDEPYDEPLAPEVESIEFAYFDPAAVVAPGSGTSSNHSSGNTSSGWLEAWDMDERQVLPAAVRITVAIRRSSADKSWLSAWSTEDTASQNVIYSLVVPIPIKQDGGTQPEESEE